MILGVIRGILPDERTTILKLQVNFLGVIDFEQGRFSFDASLFDSKLLSFTLSGDMAMRLYWGANANFLTDRRWLPPGLSTAADESADACGA